MRKTFDIEETLLQMTVEEKVLLLQAKDAWRLNGVERLGIPSVVLTDGPSGVRLMTDPAEDAILSTTMPTESILSASWNTDLIREVGETLGKEAQHFGVSILLGPGVNAKRSPLGGRNFEYYSEDPYLSGTLAAAMIEGVQSQGVGTSLKHYVANDQETRRFSMDSIVDERTLREICLKPFEMAIKKAKPWTVMGAYPRVNGTFACENAYLLEVILREEYGYEGVTLSDWGAAWNKVESHKNGLDLETGSFESYEEMLEAVQSGYISQDCLDTHVRRVLGLLKKILEGAKTVEINWDHQHCVAKKAAEECIVLLKNEASVLPLKKGTKVAVIGGLAKEPHISGGGSSSTVPRIMELPIPNLEKYADVTFAMGYSTIQPDMELIQEACEVGEAADSIIVFIGTLAGMDSEGSDRTDMSLSESQLALLKELSKCRKPVIAVNSSGSAVDLRVVMETAQAIVHCGLLGEGGGCAVADIIFGEVNPSGKLTETFPLCIENTPVYPFYPGQSDDVIYREELLVGYRYYDMKKIPVAYPFGHGLSYSKFKYSDMQLSSKRIKKGDSLTVTVDVTNEGDMAGAEIIQLYVADTESYLLRPEKELKGFAKIYMNPGETKKAAIELDTEAFAYYVPNIHSYAVESGEFRILVGASSQDIRLTDTVYVESEDEVRDLLTDGNTIGEFYEDERYSHRVDAVFAQMNMTKDHPAYPMLVGARLKDLPTFMGYMNVPEAVSMQMVKTILGE